MPSCRFAGDGNEEAAFGAAQAAERDLARGEDRRVKNQRVDKPEALGRLRNIGKAALADFQILGVATVSQLAAADADMLYVQLCKATGRRHDPCVHDVFSAAIHQARTGEALDWPQFTPARKARQAEGRFPTA